MKLLVRITKQDTERELNKERGININPKTQFQHPRAAPSQVLYTDFRKVLETAMFLTIFRTVEREYRKNLDHSNSLLRFRLIMIVIGEEMHLAGKVRPLA